jgi:hypothetical protein
VDLACRFNAKKQAKILALCLEQKTLETMLANQLMDWLVA